MECLSYLLSVNEHNIMFDFEHIFERTLGGTEPKTSSEIGVQVELLTESSSDAKSTQNQKRRKRCASSECSTPDQNDNRTSKRVKRAPRSRTPSPSPASKKVSVPWYAGTEYQCRVCREAIQCCREFNSVT